MVGVQTQRYVKIGGDGPVQMKFYGTIKRNVMMLLSV